MASTKNQSQYINTMVFCIVAGIISLMLLLLVMNTNDTVRAYSPMVITIEISIVIIIISAVYKIIQHERAANKVAVDGYTASLNVTSCPDYWTRSGETCKNVFYNSTNNETYYFFGSNQPAGAPSSSDMKTFNLSNYNNKAIDFTCSNVHHKGYYPWSQVDAVCRSFRLNG